MCNISGVKNVIGLIPFSGLGGDPPLNIKLKKFTYNQLRRPENAIRRGADFAVFPGLASLLLFSGPASNKH